MTRSAGRWGVVAGALWAATLAMFWPGIAEYDSVAQFQQVVSGDYTDWHPPIMARVWSVAHAVFGGGAAPMLAIQLTCWWAGLGLIAGGLAARGRVWSAAALCAIGLLPPFLGWQVAVLKDGQMAGALVAATGLIGWWRLRDRPVPWPVWGAAATLLVYATLLRANAPFSTIPLAVLLVPGLRARRRWGLAFVAIVCCFAIAGPINHRLLGAESSGVERAAPLFDLAGIAAREPEAVALPLTIGERRVIAAKRCVTPLFWDPLGDDRYCAVDLARPRSMPTVELYRALAATVLAHPIAYARHRLSHLNATDRWLVPARLPGAAPLDGGEPNTLGLRDPGEAAMAVQRAGASVVETPLGWPIFWTVLAVLAIATAWRRPRAPARDLALALAVSAVTQEASFAVLSIASDLRYHLWAMVAAAIAVVLLADRPPSPGVRRWGGAVLALVLIGGAVARMTLPPAPPDYDDVLVWPGMPSI